MILECEYCKKSIDRYGRSLKCKHNFCSKKCKGQYQKAHYKLQPNFNLDGCIFIKYDSKQIGKTKRKFWTIKCQCGQEFIRRQDHVYRQMTYKTILHCGCKQEYPTGDNHPAYNGIGDLSGGYFCSIQAHAKDRNLEFNITKQQIWDLFLQQDKKCALTQQDIILSQSRKTKDQTASLDRIDSSKGYIIDNVQWLHKDVNLMKNHFSQQRFIEICNQVASKHPIL